MIMLLSLCDELHIVYKKLMLSIHYYSLKPLYLPDILAAPSYMTVLLI